MWHEQVYDYIMCSYKKYPYPPPPHFDWIILSPGGGTLHMKGVGMPAANFELNP